MPIYWYKNSGKFINLNFEEKNMNDSTTIAKIENILKVSILEEVKFEDYLFSGDFKSFEGLLLSKFQKLYDDVSHYWISKICELADFKEVLRDFGNSLG